MKKNRMMRIASVLLVAVLMSTCAISGTFAKYTTTVIGSDEARVAKWGIGSNLDEAATFGTTYSTDHPNSIVSNSSDVVGPGASDEGVYELNGTPEVAYQITFDMTNVKDVFLKAASYKYTFGDTKIQYDGLQNKNDYYPIKWKVTLTTTGTVDDKGSNDDATYPTRVEQTNEYTANYNKLSEVEAALEDTKIDFAANQTCDVVLTISWEWAFENNDQANPAITHIDDHADTILANLSTEPSSVKKSDSTALVDGTDYSTTVAYNLAITATQIQLPAPR